MASRHDLYVGRAGQRAVMAELLFRGYNVAVPDADIGDDLFVVADDTGRLWRVQVKTSTLQPRREPGAAKGQFWIPLPQLLTPKRPELHYVLAARWPQCTPLAPPSGPAQRTPLAPVRRSLLPVALAPPSGRAATPARSASERAPKTLRGRERASNPPIREREGTSKTPPPPFTPISEHQRSVHPPSSILHPRSSPSARWDYVVISRSDLLRLREDRAFGTPYRGRLLLAITFRPDSLRGYGIDLQKYRNNWTRYWPLRPRDR